MIRFSLFGPILVSLMLWLCPSGPPSDGRPQEFRQLTSHGATDYHPVFSPSGNEVLFTSRREEDAALIRIAFDGGDLTEVPIGLAGDLYSDWHPDGRSIVFDARDAGGPPDIFRFWLESGELLKLTEHAGMDGHPSFSPDGHQIVFRSTRGGNGDIWIMDVEGAILRQLTHHTGGDWHPKWSPDGRHILFSSDRDGDADIWIIDVDGSRLRKLTSMPGVADRGSWSPDGARVVFQWEGDLWLVDSGGGDPEQLTDLPGREGNPAWSPDGRPIVFEADISAHIHLCIVRLPML